MRSFQIFLEDSFEAPGPDYASFVRSVVAVAVGSLDDTLTSEAVDELKNRAIVALGAPVGTSSAAVFAGSGSITTANEKVRSSWMGIQSDVTKLEAGAWISLPGSLPGHEATPHAVRLVDGPRSDEALVALRMLAFINH
jgi:hypothetical protein